MKMSEVFASCWTRPNRPSA